MSKKSTRELILDAATTLFIEHGFKETTIRDICRAAGVNVAAVNYHFKSKRQLITASIDAILARRSQQQLKLLSGREINSESEWRQVIIDFINGMILGHNSKTRDESVLLRLFISELKDEPEFFTTLHQKYFGPLDRELTRYIKMGLEPDAPPEAASFWMITILSQCLLFRHHQNVLNCLSGLDFSQPENSEKLAKHIANTVFAGLKYHQTTIKKN